MLLAENANPIIKTFQGLTPEQATDSYVIKSYLQKAHLVSHDKIQFIFTLFS